MVQYAMAKTIKTCYFQIDGPVRQQNINMQWSTAQRVNTLLDYPGILLACAPNEVVELPRVRFQAMMMFHRTTDKRVIMKDRFGREWSVYNSCINQLIPAMTRGAIECYWEIVKRGSMYCIVSDVNAPLGTVKPDQDVPLMLDTVYDLRSLVSQFEDLAI